MLINHLRSHCWCVTSNTLLLQIDTFYPRLLWISYFALFLEDRRRFLIGLPSPSPAVRWTPRHEHPTAWADLSASLYPALGTPGSSSSGLTSCSGQVHSGAFSRLPSLLPFLLVIPTSFLLHNISQPALALSAATLPPGTDFCVCPFFQSQSKHTVCEGPQKWGIYDMTHNTRTFRDDLGACHYSSCSPTQLGMLEQLPHPGSMYIGCTQKISMPVFCKCTYLTKHPLLPDTCPILPLRLLSPWMASHSYLFHQHLPTVLSSPLGQHGKGP